MEAPKKSKSSKDKSKGDKKIKKSGVRTKFLIESLRNDYYALREENERLRILVTDNLSEDASSAILADCFDPNAPKVSKDSIDELAGKMAGADVDDDEDEDDAVGF